MSDCGGGGRKGAGRIAYCLDAVAMLTPGRRRAVFGGPERSGEKRRLALLTRPPEAMLGAALSPTPTTTQLLVLLMLPLAAPPPANAIECFVCNSMQDPRCADPFLGNGTSPALALKALPCERDVSSPRAALQTVATLLTRLGQAPDLPSPSQASNVNDDDATPTAAPSTCLKLHVTVLGQPVTARDCAGAVMDKQHPCDSYKLISTSEILLQYCGVCETDSCNGQSILRPLLFVHLLLLAVLRM